MFCNGREEDTSRDARHPVHFLRPSHRFNPRPLSPLAAVPLQLEGLSVDRQDFFFGRRSNPMLDAWVSPLVSLWTIFAWTGEGLWTGGGGALDRRRGTLDERQDICVG